MDKSLARATVRNADVALDEGVPRGLVDRRIADGGDHALGVDDLGPDHLGPVVEV